ncbi:MAG: XdhC family protein [Euryarchaeota archaeon]|nr:XdhC family protein [Euryarchaeota archaeon]MBT3847180.1 XdhC family protein [Euryarchaeota archaeon]MBT4156667.1 XdhC family protein [Euryarchaeota archaeon]MBT4794106.1 XdhC family protein [Euryarchaeota archaeon]MBT6072971.1 XdhC family protein [Euryarchaeota archaeon]
MSQIKLGKRVAIATVISAKGSVPGKPGAKLAITSDNQTFGTVGGAGLELRIQNNLENLLTKDSGLSRKEGGSIEIFQLYKDAKGKEVTALDSLCGGQVTVSMEVIEPVPHILIAGGGHVGRCVALVADSLGWDYSIFDVRKEYSNPEKYPFAVDTISASVEDFLNSENNESIQRFSDILLLGHDWSVDQELLLRSLKIRGEQMRPRIGAIGSTSKWKAFKKAAMSHGVNEEWFNSARCPIGIDIGAETPEEIGLAVCAEILLLEKKA